MNDIQTELSQYPICLRPVLREKWMSNQPQIKRITVQVYSPDPEPLQIEEETSEEAGRCTRLIGACVIAGSLLLSWCLWGGVWWFVAGLSGGGRP